MASFMNGSWPAMRVVACMALYSFDLLSIYSRRENADKFQAVPKTSCPLRVVFCVRSVVFPDSDELPTPARVGTIGIRADFRS